MQYLCLVYFEPEVFERMSPEEKRTLNRDSLNYDDALRAGGHYLHSNALDSVEKAVTVQGAQRQDVDRGRSIRRDQGTSLRLHPDRGRRYRRGDAIGFGNTACQAWQHRGASHLPYRGSAMKKYVCLIYLDEADFEPMTQRQRDGFVNAMLDNGEAMRRSGNFVDAHALALPPAAVSVRVRGGKLSATDGPFAETKEHLSGFIVIEARDLNEAIRLAGDIPVATVGTIEVRPVIRIERVDPDD